MTGRSKIVADVNQGRSGSGCSIEFKVIMQDRRQMVKDGEIQGLDLMMCFHNPPLKRKPTKEPEYFSILRISDVVEWPSKVSKDHRLTTQERKTRHRLTQVDPDTGNTYVHKNIRLFARIEHGKKTKTISVLFQ